MKKKLFIVLLIGFISGILLTNNVYSSYYSNNIISNTTTSNLVKSNSIAMMLETDLGSNEYYLSTDAAWPDSSEYTFNSTLSKCENGASLSWDDDNNQVLMTGSSSDKCYIYFDKTDNTLANYIISLYTEDGENNLYYFDGEGSYTNADLEANDLSYRYSGPNDSTHNYVCFGDDDCTDTENLYRIIGVFLNEDDEYEVKLIKAEYCTSEQCGGSGVGDYYSSYSDANDIWAYNASTYYIGTQDIENFGAYYWNYTNYDTADYNNDWSISVLNKTNLNTYYLEYIGETWSNLIVNHSWIVGGNTIELISNSTALSAYLYEIEYPNTIQVASIFEAKVGLMYNSEYYYTSSPEYWNYPGINSTTSVSPYEDYRDAITYNWLYLGAAEWTITRTSSVASLQVFILGPSGNLTVSFMGNSLLRAYAIRPTFYLSSSVEYSSGTGNINDPIILVTN